MTPIISLLTDFGLKSPYVAQVKATLLQNCPEATVIDITNQVERHNIVEGAFLLEMAVPFFPNGSVHLAVVDPGVGSGRLPVVVACKDGSSLVGPDNGLLVRASELIGVRKAYRIENPGFTRGTVSKTFHGRDVFAIAAAKIASGSSPQQAGRSVAGLEKLDAPKVTVGKGRVDCSVIHVDVFGNLITNARERDIAKAGFKQDGKLFLKGRDKSVSALLTTSYYKVEKREFLVLEGSQGYVEVSCREGDAAKEMKLRSLDKLTISG